MVKSVDNCKGEITGFEKFGVDLNNFFLSSQSSTSVSQFDYNIMATNKTQHMICENSHTLCDCGMMRPSNSDTPTVCECKGSHATCSCGGADLCVCSGRFSRCEGDRGKLVVCPGGFTKCHKGKAGEMLDHDMFGFLWFPVALTSLYSCVAVPSIIAYYFGQ